MPQDTKSLPSRKPSAEEQEIIDEVLSLYQARPTEKSYSHYAPGAVFHDPVCLPKKRSAATSVSLTNIFGPGQHSQRPSQHTVAIQRHAQSLQGKHHQRIPGPR